MQKDMHDSLYHTDRLAGKLLNGVVFCMLFLAALAGLNALLAHIGIYINACCAWPILLLAYKYAWIICGIMAVFCILCRVALSPFVKSEEQEEFEQKVEYVLQQKKIAKRQQVNADYSPFLNLTSDQEMKIRQILHDLPANPNNPDSISLALVSQYLTALEKMGHLDMKDKYHLRLWIEQVTEKSAPSSSQFNEAIPSKTATKISQARKELERVLGQ